MKRQTLQLMLLMGPMIALSSLLSCRSTRDAQAPVSTSAAPTAFLRSPDDLRPPSPGEEAKQPEPGNRSAEEKELELTPTTGNVDGANVQPVKVAVESASAPLSPNALAVAARLYVEAQGLEATHAYPQAVAAYDRLLERDSDYADARERRATLLELVRLADELYVKAMDTTSTESRLHYLSMLDQFWPEYRDVPQQLHQLQRAAAKARSEAKQASGSGKPKPAAKD